MEFQHISVLLNECIGGLAIDPDGVYVDGTAGGAGHSAEIAKRLVSGRLIAVDKDPQAVKTAAGRLADYPQATVVTGDFRDVGRILDSLSIEGVNGILLDLGVSSHQLDTPERGFSYHQNAPLDMRMAQSGISAKEILNEYSADALVKIFRDYGEEKFARRIAVNIEKSRQIKPLETTFELVDIIRKSIPAAARREGGHPAKRVFQAVRIAVNGELDALEEGIGSAFSKLLPEGRLAIITFHSLEDRIVKQAFAKFCAGCTCPPDFPVCVCGNKPKAMLVNKKPIEASQEEQARNSRSKSAKLRILEKL